MVWPIPGAPLRSTPGFYQTRLRRLRVDILGRSPNRFQRIRKTVHPGSNIITDTASFSDLSFLFATNVEIDPELIKAALSLGGKRSKRAVIDEALREYVLRRQQRDIIKLFGSIDYDESYDYKKQRSRR